MVKASRAARKLLTTNCKSQHRVAQSQTPTSNHDGNTDSTAGAEGGERQVQCLLRTRLVVKETTGLSTMMLATAANGCSTALAEGFARLAERMLCDGAVSSVSVKSRLPADPSGQNTVSGSTCRTVKRHHDLLSPSGSWSLAQDAVHMVQLPVCANQPACAQH